MIRRSLPALFGLLLAGELWAAEAGYTFRAADLKREPFNDAETVAAVPEQTALSVLARQGGWYQVELPDGARGWLRMVGVRLGTAGKGGGDSGFGKALSFLTTGRSGSSGVTAATGIRGLEPADLVDATPDPDAVAALETSKVDAKGARTFAAKAKLASNRIEYVEPPKAETRSAPGGGLFGDN